MNPENTQPADESASLPPPPPYMPPMNESQAPISGPPVVDSTIPISTKKSSNTPVWAWIVIAVFIVGVLGVYGWNWYQSYMIANLVEGSRYMPDDNPQSIPKIYNNNTSTSNNCSEATDTNNVCIGDRIWMKKNLNEGVMINSSIPQTNNGIIEKYCYDNDPLKCDTYGGLYQWDEMLKYVYLNGDTSFCPTDYHVPNDTEWNSLTSYLGGGLIASYKMLSSGSSGFDSLSGGYFGRGTRGNTFFVDIGDINYYWSSMAGETNIEAKTDASSLGVFANNDGTNEGIGWTSLPKNYGLSVRCIKNLE